MSTFSVCVIFREDYNRDNVEIFRVNLTFSGLPYDVTLIIVAQNFIFSTYSM